MVDSAATIATRLNSEINEWFSRREIQRAVEEALRERPQPVPELHQCKQTALDLAKALPQSIDAAPLYDFRAQPDPDQDTVQRVRSLIDRILVEADKPVFPRFHSFKPRFSGPDNEHQAYKLREWENRKAIWQDAIRKSPSQNAETLKAAAMGMRKMLVDHLRGIIRTKPELEELCMDLLCDAIGAGGFQGDSWRLWRVRLAAAPHFLNAFNFLSEYAPSPHRRPAYAGNDAIGIAPDVIADLIDVFANEEPHATLPMKVIKEPPLADPRKPDADLSPSRIKARAAYDWAMSEIPGAENLTVAELFEAIQNNPSKAGEMLPPNAEAFAKYLRDAGIKRYGKGKDRRPSRSLRRHDQI